MSVPHGSKVLLWGLGFFLCLSRAAAGSVEESNVLVLYNTASAESVEVANYYAQVHPDVQLLGLDGVTTDEEVTDDYYRDVIRSQIINSGLLTSSISTIVTTTGLPLRVVVDDPMPQENPQYNYIDPFGVTREIGAGTTAPYYGWWREYSSLESELARIDVVSTWEQMGDQTYFDQPESSQGDPNLPHHATNPYYLPSFSLQTFQYEPNSAPFDYETYSVDGFGGVRLTARLDGFSTDDIKAAIDRAQQAFLLPGASSQSIVLDDDPNSVGTDRINNLVTVLDEHSQNYVYDNTDAAVTAVSGEVLGYISHGTNDGSGGLTSGYITDQLNLSLADGAVFYTHESYNAYSFESGENVGGQGLVAEWLAIGGTVGVGNVWEPESGRCTEVNEDQMFQMFLDGYTWVEAAWSAMQQLSYVGTVIGDPLMVWKELIPGDANMDGLVGSADLAIFGANWGATGESGGAMWGLGDFNGDGLVGSADLALLGYNWGEIADWASDSVICSAADLPDFQYALRSVPEPSSLAQTLAGVSFFLGVFFWRLGRVRRSTRKQQVAVTIQIRYS